MRNALRSSLLAVLVLAALPVANASPPDPVAVDVRPNVANDTALIVAPSVALFDAPSFDITALAFRSDYTQIERVSLVAIASRELASVVSPTPVVTRYRTIAVRSTTPTRQPDETLTLNVPRARDRPGW